MLLSWLVVVFAVLVLVAGLLWNMLTRRVLFRVFPCECVMCLIADYPHPLDFLMWRVELGYPTVRDTDLVVKPVE